MGKAGLMGTVVGASSRSDTRTLAAAVMYSETGNKHMVMGMPLHLGPWQMGDHDLEVIQESERAGCSEEDLGPVNYGAGVVKSLTFGLASG